MRCHYSVSTTPLPLLRGTGGQKRVFDHQFPGVVASCRPASPDKFGGMANPAILTVDDDPAVSRAVARDLRQRYGEQYRVVRAESGADALEALKELKLRGEQVALLLADYRLPSMHGTRRP